MFDQKLFLNLKIGVCKFIFIKLNQCVNKELEVLFDFVIEIRNVNKTIRKERRRRRRPILQTKQESCSSFYFLFLELVPKIDLEFLGNQREEIAIFKETTSKINFSLRIYVQKNMAAMANSVSSTETSAPSETNTFSESGKSQLTGNCHF